MIDNDSVHLVLMQCDVYPRTLNISWKKKSAFRMKCQSSILRQTADCRPDHEPQHFATIINQLLETRSCLGNR